MFLEIISPILLFPLLILGAPSEDEVTNLPGLNFETNYKQYSGYLQATETRYLHYWFFESQNKPRNDPVVLWMNGGPGCSSLIGLFNELGPFFVNQKGTGELHENPWSWNTFSNLLFLEAPACVGFSYSEDNCRSSDDTTAQQNYAAIQDFFRKFPEYQENEFYVTGESYCGTYIPTLTELIVDGEATSEVPFNFQGFAIGNGCFDNPLNENSLMFFGYYHGVLGEDLWSNLTASCCTGPGNPENCDFYSSTDSVCQNFVVAAYLQMYYNGLNPYNLYSTCGSSVTKSSKFKVELGRIARKLNIKMPRQTYGRQAERDSQDYGYDPDCTDNAIEIAYLNSDDVKKALHISPKAPKWKPCTRLPYQEIYSSTVDKIEKVAKASRALIYNGDVDMVCNVFGNLWGVEQIGFPVEEKHRTWSYNGQVHGYVKRFTNLDFLTVKGAGHEVPGYQPAASLHFIKAFILRQPY